MREKTNQYDIIADIHGRWDKLEPLLAKLGYHHNGNCHAHPTGRVALFLGDLIDPKGGYPNGTREVLHCVRDMVASGQARCILGNHEYNFVAYHTPDGQEGYLRPHSEKNDRMHAGTHAALESHPAELDEVWLPWLKTLPFFLDLPELRVVHACWHPEYVSMLEGKTLADGELLRNSSIKGTPEYFAVETVLKGVELPMPTGHHFFDHQGNKRTEFRARWWDKEEPLPTAKNMLFPPVEDFPDTPLLPEDVEALPGYNAAEKPVFIGHYYKPADSPLEMEASNLCCLDFSAATEGSLTTYVWDGPHTTLDSDYLISSTGDRSELPFLDGIISFLRTMPALLCEGYDGANAWTALLDGHVEVVNYDLCGDVYRDWIESGLEQYPIEVLYDEWIGETGYGSGFGVMRCSYGYLYDFRSDNDRDPLLEEVPQSEILSELTLHFEAKLFNRVEDFNNAREWASWEEDEDEDDLHEEEEELDDDPGEDESADGDVGAAAMDDNSTKSPDVSQEPSDSPESCSNSDGFYRFFWAANNCASVMLDNAFYIQEALPTIEVEERYQERIKVVCEELIGTRFDIVSELRDLEEALGNEGEGKKCHKLTERIVRWLREPIATLHDTVSLLKQDSNTSLPFILVAESGVNIMNAFNHVGEAYDNLKGQ